MRRKASPSTNNWASLLQRALNDARVLPPGKGWERFEEIKSRTGVGQVRLHKILKQEIEAGRVEVFHGSDIGAGDRRVRATWYREVRK